MLTHRLHACVLAVILALASLVAVDMARAADEPVGSIGFRGQRQASVNSTSVALPIPDAVVAGDSLVLFVTANRADITLSTPNADPSWRSLTTVVDSSMQTTAWWNVAGANDAGRTVVVTSSVQAKIDAQLLAYHGTDGVEPMSGFAAIDEPVLRAEHTTPTVGGAPAGSWALSYWADKTSSSTGWASPAGAVERGESGGTGAGRIASLSADSNGPVASSLVGGNVAVSTAASDKATMWTIALKPSSASPPPEPDPTPPPPTPGAIAEWNLDEAGGAVVVDSSGNGLDLVRGTQVQVGVHDGTAIMHRFPWISATAPASPEGRLHTLADNDALDAGSGTFVVSLRFKTGVSARNIVQKGQSTTVGGFWKVEIGGKDPTTGLSGQARCLFRGAKGDSYTHSGTVSVTDNMWHEMTCVNHPGGSYMLLDGKLRTSTKPSGAINNTKVFAIGGKASCDNINVSCDYFVGDIDYVRLSSVAP